ncbi:hypothetical protein EUTSA_v10003060mg [Eutrema salsugineum]|uniref:RNase H type-1 domain-containing protein n=1 Tax=Eutrema salsugineum TaxID=72664 RepID=V4L1L7_EUTSA|nr:hypothetical protein EUTSA_v10003060mg [Eutrema salsugineum]
MKKGRFCGWVRELSLNFEHLLDTELEALRWAISSSRRFGFPHIIIESDSKEAVDIAKHGSEWPAFSPVIQDIRRMLSSLVDQRIVFNPRGCNSVADRVAKEALSFQNFAPKFYSVMPEWLSQIVNLDGSNI